MKHEKEPRLGHFMDILIAWGIIVLAILGWAVLIKRLLVG
jgi:hypothetical protein